MKKICTLLLAASLVFGAATSAQSITFKAKGQWLVGFDMGGNGDFTAGGKRAKTGWGKIGEDQFNAFSRVRLQLDAEASKNLSGTVVFQIGTHMWGKARTGGALGTDGKVVRVKHAYLDWVIPNTNAKVRMGIQPMRLPSDVLGSQIFNDDTAGVTVSYKFTDEVAATVFWARPYNDNGKDWKGNAGHMDNVDMFGLSVPVTLDGVKVTPFGMLAFVGPNAFRDVNQTNSALDQQLQSNIVGGPLPTLNRRFARGWPDTYAGLFPFGGNVKQKKITSYGTAWWAGLTTDITVFDPLRIAVEFNYGSVKWDDDASLNRAGWLAAGLVEYKTKTDWGIPGLMGWYASGDYDNRKNGSERLPFMGPNSTNNAFSSFAFSGQPWRGARESIIGKTMVGTWGVGLRLKDVSFVEDLKHTLRVHYIGGTNSPRMTKRHDAQMKMNPFLGAAVMGQESLYMNTNDTAVELGLATTYKIYDNLTMYLEGSYLFTSLDYNRAYSDVSGKRSDIRDPWNINLTFAYTF